MSTNIDMMNVEVIPPVAIFNKPPFIGLLKNEHLTELESKPVTEVTDEIKTHMEAMHKALEHGKFTNGRGGLAIAHAQISVNPYNFFCVKETELWEAVTIFNMKIVGVSGRMKNKYEMCLSYPFRKKQSVERFNDILVQYQVYSKFEDKLMPVEEESLTGLIAQIFQHEYDHIMGTDIYGNTVMRNFMKK